jgi:hypothetical protein
MSNSANPTQNDSIDKQKCFAMNTPMLMFDGSIKLSQNVVVGDNLMGDDSTCRTVLFVEEGEDSLYEIQPSRGDKHVVTENHFLNLKLSCLGIEKSRAKNPTYITRTLNKEHRKLDIKHFTSKEQAHVYLQELKDEENTIQMTLGDFMRSSSKFKSNLKLFRKGVDFPAITIDFDPYILGVWLGDGGQRDTVITNQDARLLLYIRNTLPRYGLMLNYMSGYDYRVSSCTSEKCKKGKNVFLTTLKKYNMINNKHIPNIIKYNSVDIRLQVLAGLIDTDGSVNSNCYEITQEREKLMDDIVFLARSLGFAAYKKVKKGSYQNKHGIKVEGTYYRTYISGHHLENIPVKTLRKEVQARRQKKDVLVTGFTTTKLSIGTFHKICIDENQRCLLGDFTTV